MTIARVMDIVDIAHRTAQFDTGASLRDALDELSRGWPVLVKADDTYHLITPADVVGHSPSRRLVDLPSKQVHPLAPETPLPVAMAQCADFDFVVVDGEQGLAVVSRLKLVEAMLSALNTSEAKDATPAILEILDQTRDGVVLVTSDGKVQSLNTVGNRALKVIGVDESELAEGRFAGVPLSILEEDARMGTPRDIEVSEPMLRILAIRAVGTGSPDKGGMLLLIRDVTHIRHRQAREAAMERMVLLGEIACGVAHDLNNVLTVITGATSLMSMQSEGSKDTGRELALIQGAAGRATELVRQLLAFGRKELTRPKPLNTVGIVRELESMLRRIAGDRVQVEFDLDPASPWVMADAVQVERILSNLVANARHAMPDGGRVRVEVRPEPRCAWLRLDPGQEPREGVLIRVQDTGVGMDAVTASRIFEPYFTTNPGLGTGLGLSTVHSTVDHLGGHVCVRSEPGEGSRFDVYLPATSEEPCREPAQGFHVPAKVGRKSGTLLLVENDPDVAQMLGRLLDHRGYSVTSSSSLDEARDQVNATGEPDLLITEASLPGTSGLDLAREFRKRFPALRVLIMSGYAVNGLLNEAQDPYVDYIAKPFSGPQLLEKVSDLAGAGEA